jgi:hypothetical protein
MFSFKTDEDEDDVIGHDDLWLGGEDFVGK